ncbi:MAG: TatD family hydrolase [Pseudomonadota bacterium]
MQYIDTHCHLTWPNIYDKIEQVLKNAKANNINYLHTISTKESDLKEIFHVLNQYGDEYNIYGSVGVHPNDAAKGEFMSMNSILKYINSSNRIISIGETGLDKFRSDDGFEHQKKSFEQHIEAGLSEDLPLVIHSRDAEKETYEMLQSYNIGNKRVKGILHCFTGSKEFAKKCLDLGLFISFSGIITFKNSHLAEIVKYIPLDMIVAETDAPYLTPVPFRGKPNEPAYVKYVYDKIAQLKNLDEKGVQQIIANGFNILGIA